MRRLLPVLLAFLAACAFSRPAPRAGEAAIRPADALADVAWLADPSRTGRGVGTPGDAAAAGWIADRMRALGLAPGGPEGFLQAFEAPVGARLEGENALEVEGATLALGQEWQPFTFSDTGVAAGELAFAGYGITAPALGYDDYAGLEVKGKVVLVAGHFPREADAASPFRDPTAYSYGEWRYKAMNARDHGAAGILMVRDDWNHPGADDLPAWRGQVSSRAGLVAARATLAGLRRVGVDAAALAAPIAAAEGPARPASRALAKRVRLAAGVVQERARTANVVGLLPGADPARAAECVVVGAHFDHLGFGGEASLAPEATGAVHPGADDNASGTAAMLQIARAFAAGPRPRRTVAFVAFSAEELGLLGSGHFVKNPIAACPPERTQLMVNLDMVGRPGKGKVYVDGADTAVGLREDVEALAGRAPAVPLQLAFGAGDGYGPSDHTSFYARGVPVLFFFTGAHLDYHRPSDTAEKIDGAGLSAVARLAWRCAWAASERRARLEVVRTPPPPGTGGERGDRASGYGAYLGSIPDFEERQEPGVLLTGVRPGSPAEKGGLRGGDVILQVGRQRIGNLQDLTYALRAHRPGDAVEVVWARGAETMRARVTLAERR
ncbi:MAG TPA: M20/M25/M40 family metallo-hydrolase [Anaeromyxobacteraceae bacterium]|jgi:hypothetical protein